MTTTAYYPPQIEGKIPAQYGTILRIPYTAGFAPSTQNEMSARIKTIVNNTVVQTLKTTSMETFDGQTFAIFTVQEDLLKVGQHYKIQLSWGEDAIYSTVGVFRYTSEPSVMIESLLETGVSRHLNEYLAIYKNDDIAEKPYQYRFILVKNSKVIESSGLKNYDEGAMRYRFKTNLTKSQLYTVQCLVYTTGGLTVRSPMYYIKAQDEYELQVKAVISAESSAESNYNNGSIKVTVSPPEGGILCGKYRILRADSLNDFNIWDELADIEINTNVPWEMFEDKTVQQGIGYKYAIQQYNEDVYTTKLETDVTICDFEDMFLFDGERQLRIRFNPKVSTFKTVNLEQKIETIGSKYPFIFRNGYTNYKEFALSGLISLLMDDNNEFMDFYKENESREATQSTNTIPFGFLTNLSGNNFANEREFKLEVLNWLTNGKPKLFRSPAEGNYIVRLMNVSLQPNDTLGRMLHTFQATAYEIADSTYESLLAHGLIQKVKNNLTLLNYSSINLLDYRELTNIVINQGKIITIREATPGAEFIIILQDGEKINITVGSTGYYQYIADGADYITGITINPKYSGIVDIAQYGQPIYPIIDKINDNVVEILNYRYEEHFKQFIGETDILSKISESGNPNELLTITKVSVLHVETIPDKTEDFELKLGDNNIIDLTPSGNNRGRVIYTSDGENIFLPEQIEIGAGLVAYIYYTVRITEMG